MYSSMQKNDIKRFTFIRIIPRLDIT